MFVTHMASKSYQTIAQCCEKQQQTKQALSLAETSFLFQALSEMDKCIKEDEKMTDSVKKAYQTIVQCCERTQQTKQALSIAEVSLLYQSLLVLKTWVGSKGNAVPLGESKGNAVPLKQLAVVPEDKPLVE